MTHPTIEALVLRHRLPHVDEASLGRFLEDAEADDRAALLFFPGEIGRRPESSDVATVVPELLKAFDQRLVGAVVARHAESALKLRFRVTVEPSLVLLRGRRTVGVIPRILDWSAYLTTIEELLRSSQAEPRGRSTPAGSISETGKDPS